MKLAIALAGSFALALLGCSDPMLAQSPAPYTAPAGPPAAPTAFPRGITDGGAHQAYPIILAHGLDGFENIGPIDYFYGVADALRKDGHVVFTPEVDAYNSSEVRGAELQAFVEDVLESTGAAKVDLICHSQGGLDCRYVASNLGPKIAAVVTIATPHRGTPVADIAEGDLPGPAKDAVNALLNVLGATIDNGQMDMNAQAALEVLTASGAEAFGVRHPDSPQVRYYSIAGRSNGAPGDDGCATPTEAPFIARWDGYDDPINPLLAATGSILSSDVSPPPLNDGLVPVASARYGTFLGCVPADHLDEMCQIAGASPGVGNAFDCHLFYRQLADWLVAQGD